MTLSDLVTGKVDILVISETKIDASFPSPQFLIPGFTEPCRRDRSGFTEPSRWDRSEFTEPYRRDRSGFTEPYRRAISGLTEPYRRDRSEFTEPYRRDRSEFTEPYRRDRSEFTEPYRQDRSEFGGGLILCVNDHIPSKLVFKSAADNESLFVEINLYKKKYLIGATYIPCKTSISKHLITLGKDMDTIIPNYDNIILMGDFNRPFYG